MAIYHHGAPWGFAIWLWNENSTFPPSLNCVPCVLKTYSCVNVPCVLTCSRALRTYVLTFLCAFACSHIHEPECLAWLRAYVPTCLACLGVAYQRAFCAHVSECLACLRVHVPTYLACLRAHLLTYPKCLCAHVPMYLSAWVLTCQRLLRAYVLTCKRAILSNIN